MSKPVIQAFREKLAQDDALRSEMERVLSAGGAKATASIDELVEFAAAHGFAISADDVRGSVELSDRDLDAVAGGFADGSVKLGTSSQAIHIESFSMNFSKVDFEYKKRG